MKTIRAQRKALKEMRTDSTSLLLNTDFSTERQREDPTDQLPISRAISNSRVSI